MRDEGGGREPCTCKGLKPQQQRLPSWENVKYKKPRRGAREMVQWFRMPVLSQKTQFSSQHPCWEAHSYLKLGLQEI